jgi:hypothetical protein
LTVEIDSFHVAYVVVGLLSSCHCGLLLVQESVLVGLVVQMLWRQVLVLWCK